MPIPLALIGAGLELASGLVGNWLQPENMTSSNRSQMTAFGYGDPGYSTSTRQVATIGTQVVQAAGGFAMGYAGNQYQQGYSKKKSYSSRYKKKTYSSSRYSSGGYRSGYSSNRYGGGYNSYSNYSGRRY